MANTGEESHKFTCDCPFCLQLFGAVVPRFHLLFNSILQQLSQTFSWDYAEVWVPVKEQGTFRRLELCRECYFVTESDPLLLEFFQSSCYLPFDINCGLPGRVFATGQPELQQRWVLSIFTLTAKAHLLSLC